MPQPIRSTDPKVPLPKGGVLKDLQTVLIPDPDGCPPPCECPDPQCFKWCIRRVGECHYEAKNGDTVVVANSEKNLSELIKSVSTKEYVANNGPCQCDSSNTGCASRESKPFACLSREWLVQVEYRPDCTDYFGDCRVPRKHPCYD